MFYYGSSMFQIETSSGRVGHRAMKTSASSLKAGRRRSGRDGRASAVPARCSRCSMEWRGDQDRPRRPSMTCARGENHPRPPCSFHPFTPWRGPLTPVAPHPQTRRRAPPDARRRAPPQPFRHLEEPVEELVEDSCRRAPCCSCRPVRRSYTMELGPWAAPRGCSSGPPHTFHMKGAKDDQQGPLD